MTVYTYSNLGTNGAAGNQLWEIAGTVGSAHRRGADVSLPTWEYAKWFSIPEEYFLPIQDQDDVIDLYPDYLQNLSLWEDVEHVHDILAFSTHAWGELFKHYDNLLSRDMDMIAVQVRRANNLKLPDHHPVPTNAYFEEAIDRMGPGQLVVFSDDLDWCRKQAMFRDAIFAIGNDPSVDVYELTGAKPLFLDSVMLDLIFMAQCDKHIISNSSFGWWGAYLAYGIDVIYPSKWYGKALSHIDTTVMFPDYWTKV